MNFAHISKTMIRKFRQFLLNQLQWSPGQKVLLAVSGGIDSMVMADLFARAGIPTGMAHCNFGLRDAESDGDERFVAERAAHYGMPLHVRHFTQQDFKDLPGQSVQMAARELRYRWFEEVLDTKGYEFIATAHHLDDQAETFLINLVRGTGLAGLHGILPKQGRLIRPLLFSTRPEIIRYRERHRLPFREDTSNLEDKYLRNQIRHQLLPILTGMNPSFTERLTSTIAIVKGHEQLVKRIITEAREAMVVVQGKRTMVNFKALKATEPVTLFAWEILSPYGFNAAQIDNIINKTNRKSGVTFTSAQYRLIKNREELIITPIREPSKGRPGVAGAPPTQIDSAQVTLIGAGDHTIDIPIRMSFRYQPCEPGQKISGQSDTATLDAAKLSFPLTLRKWRPGDAFQPFGMKGRQKVSDFLINNKVALDHKEETWVLCSGNRIAWLVGHRIDHHFRVTPGTRYTAVINAFKSHR